jgi:hypothetical protein
MTEIMHWSNHRVMEWLRSIDLSEYAPNLRGSGICGALIVRNTKKKLFLKKNFFLLKRFSNYVLMLRH